VTSELVTSRRKLGLVTNDVEFSVTTN